VNVAPLLVWLKNKVEHRRDERQTARFAGEPAHHFGAPTHLAERSLKEIR